MKWLVGAILVMIAGFGGWWAARSWLGTAPAVPTPTVAVKEYPLLKYSVEELRKRGGRGTRIVLEDHVATEEAYIAQKFYFFSDDKKVTGLAHIPKECERCPVVVQLRGHIDREGYESGDGTRRSAAKFAEAGFISLAPDFLGFGGSDMPSENIFEERFEKYTVGLDLLASVSSLPMADPGRVGIWGHSNGGQIALTVLAATGRPYPTVLWAPVTAQFPYSIMYYTDGAEDGGKLLRRELAEFESDYDVDEFDFNNYLDWIAGPVQIHQGTLDELVPQKWSDKLVRKLKDLDKDVTYTVYPGADHNLVPSWNTVVTRDIEFFKERLE